MSDRTLRVTLTYEVRAESDVVEQVRCLLVDRLHRDELLVDLSVEVIEGPVWDAELEALEARELVEPPSFVEGFRLVPGVQIPR